MKKLISTIIIFATVIVLPAQNTRIAFVGKDRTGQDYIQIERVSIFDLEQLWHQVLYYPDTAIVLCESGMTSVGDLEQNTLLLYQNTPNPFNGTTEFLLSLPENGDVLLELYDISGKKVAKQHYSQLQEGDHLFKATLNSPQTYLLSASFKNGTTMIKMINQGNEGESTITYLGLSEKSTNPDNIQNTKGAGLYPFRTGDLMQYTAYVTIDGIERESETIQQEQYNSSLLDMKFDMARPLVTTDLTASMSVSTGIFYGEVTSENNAHVTERGFCYSTGNNPTLNDDHVEAGEGIGTFSAQVSELQAGTVYYYRAYARNAIGVSYGELRSKQTDNTIPSVTTTAPSDLTNNSFTTGGNVLANNGAIVTARGVCWAVSPNPSINGNHTNDGNGLGSFSSTVTGLECGTTYYLRAYATNAMGTAYGEEYNVTTFSNQQTASIVCHSATATSGNTATINAEVTGDNCATVTERGVCWGITHSPSINGNHTSNGNGVGSFTNTLSGLTQGTTYYVRAYAVNSEGISYSNELSFTTFSMPSVTTNNVTNIFSNSALCGGNVTSDGGANVTARGVCWSTSPSPTVNDTHTSDGTSMGSFTSNMTDLNANTTYYVRAYATNNLGTAYGIEVSFTTSSLPTDGQPCATLTDYDGNVYNTVQLGSQCWMKENLRTTHYADGTSIPVGSTYSSTTAYRYAPNNNSSNVTIYGYLYNWPAVMHGATSSTANPSGIQGICPTGWHVPSDAEWTQLTDYVGSQSQYSCNNNTYYIAKALSNTFGWNTYSFVCSVGNNQSNNNSTGFSACPSGNYNTNGYYGFGETTYLISSTESNNNAAWSRILCYYLSGVERNANCTKSCGFSVRCLRN